MRKLLEYLMIPAIALLISCCGSDDEELRMSPGSATLREAAGFLAGIIFSAWRIDAMILISRPYYLKITLVLSQKTT